MNNSPHRDEPTVDCTILEAHRCFVGASSFLIAAVAGIFLELLYTFATGLPTVPVHRHQRFLIMAQLALFGATAAAAQFLLHRYSKRAFTADSRWAFFWATASWLVCGGVLACRGAFFPNFWPLGTFLILALITAWWSRRIDLLASTAGGVWVFGVGWGLLRGYESAGSVEMFLIGCAPAAAFQIAKVQRSIWVYRTAVSAALVLLAFIEASTVQQFWPMTLLGALAFGVGVAPTSAVKTQKWAIFSWMIALSVVLMSLRPTELEHLNLLRDMTAGWLVGGIIYCLGRFARNLNPPPRPYVDWIGAASAFVAGVAILWGSLFAAALWGTGISLWSNLFAGRNFEADSLQPPRRILLTWVFVVLALTVRGLFWWTTDRVWEDAYITIQHTQNAHAGLGLTHHPLHGHVHGFTGVINMAIPLLGGFWGIAGSLAAFRITSLLFGGLTILFAGKIADHFSVRLSTPSLVLWLSYLAFDHAQIAFGMAGMETQGWLCVLLAGVCAMLYRRMGWLILALILAGYSRPDAVLWIGVCWAAAFEWGKRESWIIAISLIAAAAPWVVFTTYYYGSPIPHTMTAKSSGYLHGIEMEGHAATFLDYCGHEFRRVMPTMEGIFSPNFGGNGLGPLPMVPFAATFQRWTAFLGVVGAIALCRSPTWPIPTYLSVWLFYIVLVVQGMQLWYPIAPLGLAGLMVAVGLDRLGAVWRPLGSGWFRWAAASIFVGSALAPLPKTFDAEKRIQEVVENGVRKEVGLWLRAHSRPDEFVAAECLGYIGFFSGLPMHDYPGLSSPRSVAALRNASWQGDRFLTPIIEQLKPTWVVLRPRELDAVTADYEKVKVIVASPEQRARLSSPMAVRTIDDEFHIFRRRDYR